MGNVVGNFWKFGNFIWFLFASMLISSCINNQDNVVPQNKLNATGQFHLMLTDDPLIIQSISNVNITIDKIALRKMDSTEVGELDSSQMNEENTSESGEMNSIGMDEHNGMDSDDLNNTYVTVLDTPQEINLMDLRNGITIDLADTNIHAGTYDMIRLYITKASIEMKNGDTFNLKMPGASTSGLKIFIPSGLVVNANNSTELLLDFNLDRSLVVLGSRDHPNGFLLKPVIRAVDNSYCGKLEGHVMDTTMRAVQGAYVWLKGDSVISSTTSEESGFYKMIGIPEGTYTLFAAMQGYDTTRIENLQLSGKRETKVDIKLIPSKN